MRHIEMLKQLMKKKQACKSSKDWVRRNSHLTPKQLWDKCQNYRYLIWLLQRSLGIDKYTETVTDLYNESIRKYPGDVLSTPLKDFIRIETKRQKYKAAKIKERIKYSDVVNGLIKREFS